MNKSWVPSIIYFINVIFHIGVFGVLFAVALPDGFTFQEYVVDFWSYPEGKEVILMNTAFLIGNLIFAFIILMFVNNSLLSTRIFAFLAWSFVLLVYLFGATGVIFSYILGAINLTIFSVNKHKILRAHFP